MTSQISLTLTGNEARLVFFAIKNKKSIEAANVRTKLLNASRDSFMKREKRNGQESVDKRNG